MDNNKIITTKDKITLNDQEFLEMMLRMHNSQAGVKSLFVREKTAPFAVMQKETQLLRRQADIELVYLYLDYDCDAARGDAYVFPVFAVEDKDKKPNQKSAIGFTVSTGYKFHHRKAEDLGFQTIGRIDYSWGESRKLTDAELKDRGIRLEESVCPDCNGTGHWKGKQDRDCYRCNNTGKLPPQRLLAVEASLNVISMAKECREAGIPYSPIKCVGFVDLDNDTAWRGADLFEKAKKRAEVACLKKYAPMRLRSGEIVGYSEQGIPQDFDPEVATEEYIANKTIINGESIEIKDDIGEPVSEQ